MKASDGTTTCKLERQTKTAGWQFNCTALYLHEQNHNCGSFECVLNWKKKLHCSAPGAQISLLDQLHYTVHRYAGTHTVVLSEDNAPIRSPKGENKSAKFKLGTLNCLYSILSNFMGHSLCSASAALFMYLFIFQRCVSSCPKVETW